MNMTAASVQNIHKQKLLELELVELERRWYIELKNIARERLGVIRDLQKIADMRKKLTHFATTLRGSSLRNYTDRELQVMNDEKEMKKALKYDFTVDPLEKVNLHLPAVTGLSNIQDRIDNERKESVHLVSSSDMFERSKNAKLGITSNSLFRTKKRRSQKKKRVSETDGGYGGIVLQHCKLKRSVDDTDAVVYGNKRKMDSSQKSSSLGNLPSIGKAPPYLKTTYTPIVSLASRPSEPHG